MAGISVGASLGVGGGGSSRTVRAASVADDRWSTRDKSSGELAWSQANFMQRVDFPDVDVGTASFMVPHVLGAKGAKISAASRASNSRLTLRYGKTSNEKNNIVIIGSTQLRVEHGARLAKELVDGAYKVALVHRKGKITEHTSKTTGRPSAPRPRAHSLPATPKPKTVVPDIVSDSEEISEDETYCDEKESAPSQQPPVVEIVDMTADEPVSPKREPEAVVAKPEMISIGTDTSTDTKPRSHLSVPGVLTPLSAIALSRYQASLHHLQTAIDHAMQSNEACAHAERKRLQRNVAASRHKLAALRNVRTWHQVQFRYPQLAAPKLGSLRKQSAAALRQRVCQTTPDDAMTPLPGFLAPFLANPKYQAQWSILQRCVPSYVPYTFFLPLSMEALPMHALRAHKVTSRAQYVAQYNVLATSLRGPAALDLEYLVQLCCVLRQLVADRLVDDEWARRGYVEPLTAAADDLFGRHTTWKLQVNQRICRRTALHPIVQPLLVDTCASYPFLWSVLSTWTTEERLEWKTPLEDASGALETVRTVLKTNVAKLELAALLQYERRVHDRVHDLLQLLSRNMLRRWQHLFTVHPELTLIGWWEKDGRQHWLDDCALPLPRAPAADDDGDADADDDVVDVTPVASISTLAGLNHLLAKCHALQHMP
ncbi:hypothetical protein ACHHYP_02639 [Achlya hypogyna]|uniref:K Homology domain-containing protein n=1 Tax=Achlya hypogyna TaxID=1202772 RepID=A0A1V9Z5Q8_ACHHY|nr:hypothetical protein ACHHYP_02639 [Achlya hypogyna]